MSSRLRASTSERRDLSSSACASASFFMRSASSLLKPLEAVMVIFCSLFVALSFADPEEFRSDGIFRAIGFHWPPAVHPAVRESQQTSDYQRRLRTFPTCVSESQCYAGSARWIRRPTFRLRVKEALRRATECPSLRRRARRLELRRPPRLLRRD